MQTTQMTPISKFKYTELYTRETENARSFSTHMVYCQKLTKYYMTTEALIYFT